MHAGLKSSCPSLEWKIEFNNPVNIHRHLSHLVGLYPGYLLADFKPPTSNSQGVPWLTRQQVLNASQVLLTSRGNGTGQDGDTGGNDCSPYTYCEI